MTIATKGDDMMDLRTAQMLAHGRNIQRYGRLLATDLTDLERQSLHKRIAEEQVALDRLAMENDSRPVSLKQMFRRLLLRLWSGSAKTVGRIPGRSKGPDGTDAGVLD